MAIYKDKGMGWPSPAQEAAPLQRLGELNVMAERLSDLCNRLEAAATVMETIGDRVFGERPVEAAENMKCDRFCGGIAGEVHDTISRALVLSMRLERAVERLSGV